MAITSFQVATLNLRMPGVTDEIIKKCVLLQQLKARKCIKYGQGGDGIKKYVRYRITAFTKAVGDFTEPQAQTTDDFKEVVGPWARYAKALGQSKFQLKRNANANDRDRNFKLMVEAMASFKQEMVSRIGTDLYADGTLLSGDTAAPIVGLGGAIAAGNTYFGVDRSAALNAWFRAQVGTENDPFGDADLVDQPNLISTMNRVWNLAEVGQQQGDNTSEDLAVSRETPDFTLCSLNAYHAYEKCLAGRVRFNVTDEADGRPKLAYNRKPLDWDTFFPATAPTQAGNDGVGGMVFLNFGHIQLQSVEENGQLFSIYAEDDTGMIKKVIMAGQMQLCCWKPAVQGRVIVNALSE